MPSNPDLLDSVHEHLADTLLLLGDCLGDPACDRRDELREAVKLLSEAQQRISKVSRDRRTSDKR